MSSISHQVFFLKANTPYASQITHFMSCGIILRVKVFDDRMVFVLDIRSYLAVAL